jgi:hypothetical protein
MSLLRPPERRSLEDFPPLRTQRLEIERAYALDLDLDRGSIS